MREKYQLFYLKLFAVALAIFGAKLWFIHNFGSPVPFWDQWDAEAGQVFWLWYNNTWTFSDLFAAHNEHRIVFTRILSLLLLLLNERQWDPLLGMVVNALVSTLTAVILIVILNNLLSSSAYENKVEKSVEKTVSNNQLNKTFQNVLLFTVALLWSLPYAWENTLASFQSQFYFMLLFSLIALWGLLHENFSLKWWIGVLFALSVGFTVASGFLILVVVIIIKLYLIVIDSGKRLFHTPTLIVSIVITGFNAWLVVRVPGHSHLLANSTYELMIAFGKALAWPWITHPSLSIVLYLPFLVLGFRTLWQRHKLSHAELLVLGLGGWVILQAASMAYARGAGGSLPVSRYMDILALGVIVNLSALYLMIQSGLSTRFFKKPYFGYFSFFERTAGLWKWIVIVGLVGLLTSTSWPEIQQKRMQNIEQLKHTREFIRTGDLSVLQNKPTRHIPHPDPELLALLLGHSQRQAILPHRLVVPQLLQSEQHGSTFIANGIYHTTEKYQNETVLGSYNQLGDRAVGRFESPSIQLNRHFMEIPVAGYLGEKDLTLQLVVEGKPEPVVITPSTLAKENWVSCYVRAPKQPFKLVAIDNNPNQFGWFAFAMPRDIGTLSFITLWLLEYGWVVFLIGMSLLFFIFCPKILRTT